MNNYKYYLTFDVGIKNLAYCIVRYDTRQSIINGIDILHWGILDVSYKPLICKNIVNKRKICNKISHFYLLEKNNKKDDHFDSNNLIGYCKSHATNLKIADKILHKKLYRVSKNDKFKDSFNIQMDRLLNALEIFFNEKILTIYHTENPYDEVINNTEYIINNLEIYIENQPVFKNPIMKTISIAIFTFFNLKKIICKNISKTNNLFSIPKNMIKSVNFISASDKTQLTFINSMKQMINLNSNISDFKEYDKRKEFTIDTTNQIISNLNKSIFNISSVLTYNNTKKKDDLADTLIYVIFILLRLKI